MQRRFALKLTTAALAATGLLSLSAHAQETIKVGVLHSLSGTMAISETALKETALMTIAEINKSGGVMGKKLEAVAREAATSAGVEADFVKVTDMKAMMAYDLLSTPGLVIDDKLVSSGRIPTQAEVRQWLAA